MTGDDDRGAQQRLEELRELVLDSDQELIRVIGERRRLVLEIGRLKSSLGRPVSDPAREAKVVRRAAQLARDGGVDEELVREVIWRIMASARDEQHGLTRWGPSDPPEGESGAP